MALVRKLCSRLVSKGKQPCRASWETDLVPLYLPSTAVYRAVGQSASPRSSVCSNRCGVPQMQKLSFLHWRSRAIKDFLC